MAPPPPVVVQTVPPYIASAWRPGTDLRRSGSEGDDETGDEVLMVGLADIPGRLLRWFRRLPTVWLGLAVVVVAAGVVGAAVALYRTYNYVQHDNDFCMSCHLMSEPYSRFARSAHRGLGCKACHQPTFAVRSKMALTQILEQPKELTVHAEVPNA
ncbi:MAG TPA: NapC/NirT family cytochrome c, partial [Longimicrobiales bacterium]|nr:NapC/NirT family cytochrome c [Longimicrobiales bacterium]